MKTSKDQRKRGQSLVEILFAIAIFTVGVITIGYLIFDSYASQRHRIETIKAVFLVDEGLEASKSIGDHDFDGLVTGTHGLLLSDGHWVFASSSDNTDGFTRSIAISDVDLETKKITSTVTWHTSDVRENSVVLSDYYTDWKSTHGDAAYLTATLSGATRNASGTAVSGITIENTGTSSVTLTGLTPQWDGGGTLDGVVLGGTTIYSVSSSSGVASGNYVDTDDYPIPAGSSAITFDSLNFSSQLSGNDLVLSLILGDGSRKHLLVSL